MNQPLGKRCTLITCINVRIDLMDWQKASNPKHSPLYVQMYMLQSFQFSGMLNAENSKPIEHFEQKKPKKNKRTRIHTNANGSSALFFDYFFFNYLLENILHQLTVKSKRCNVNHKRFSAQLKSIERKMYHFVILSSLMSFFLYFKVSMCGIVVQWHVLTHMFHWSLVQDFLAKNFTFNFEFTALKHFSYSK